MEKLRFNNPVFRNGGNFTARLGAKWLELFNQGVRQVELTDVSGQVSYGTAKLTQVAYLPFNYIPQEWLWECHDGKGRQVLGLFDLMQQAYGDRMHYNSPVTLVWFTRSDLPTGAAQVA